MRIKRYILFSLLEVFGGIIAVLFGVMIIIQWITLGKALSIHDLDVLLLAMVPMSSFVIPMGVLFTIPRSGEAVRWIRDHRHEGVRGEEPHHNPPGAAPVTLCHGAPYDISTTIGPRP
jgi:hypothetical protein